MRIRDARADDLPAIASIYNEAILATAAVWRECPVALDDRRAPEGA